MAGKKEEKIQEEPGDFGKFLEKEKEKERKATKEELEKKVDFTKVVDKKKETKGFDLMGLLNDPKVALLLKGGKDLFKKKEVDPNMCEITIKAPSEVVLKLFNVK